jgi:hypothetical protein
VILINYKTIILLLHYTSYCVVFIFLSCILQSHEIFNLIQLSSLFVWLVADGWCWFVLREKYCWLVAGGWFVLSEKYCWLMADKPSEQADLSYFPSNVLILRQIWVEYPYAHTRKTLAYVLNIMTYLDIKV